MKFIFAILAALAVGIIVTMTSVDVSHAMNMTSIPVDALSGVGLAGAGTTFKACEGRLKVEDSGMPGTFLDLGEITSWSLEESANIKRYFKIGDCNEQSGVAGISRTVSIEGNYDPTDAGQPELVPNIGDTVKIEIYPVGEGSGDEKYAITGVIESITRGGSGDDFVTFSATLSANSFTVSVVP